MKLVKNWDYRKFVAFVVTVLVSTLIHLESVHAENKFLSNSRPKHIRCEMTLSGFGLTSDFLRANDRSATQLWGQHFARINSEVADVVKDPDAFKAEINARFRAQKEVDPGAPLNFDFSEVGMIEIPIMIEKLQGKIKEFESKKERLTTFTGQMRSLFTGGEVPRLRDVFFPSKLRSEFDTAIQYLNELNDILEDHAEDGRVAYDEFIALGHYYVRVMGFFDIFNMGFQDRMFLVLERRIQGYRRFDMETELENLRGRSYEFVTRTSFLKSYQNSRSTFEGAYNAAYDMDELPYILVPSHGHFGIDIFQFLMTKDIYLLGLTDTPIRADGFLRPSGLFLIHDYMHSALMWHKQREWIKNLEISEQQWARLSEASDMWQVELKEHLLAIEDPQIRKTARRLAFNIHHEQGFPLVPSVFKSEKKVNFTSQQLFFMEWIGGETPWRFKTLTNDLNEAFEIIRDFWLSKLDEEAAVLSQD